jgi:uncharacterized protein
MKHNSCQAVKIDTGAGMLSADYFTPRNSNGRGVLFFNGWKSNKLSPRDYAFRLTDLGYSMLTVSFRGMGDSEGDINSLTRRDFLADATISYDYLARVANISDISAVGKSFGGYVACLLTEERKIESLVLCAPADYTDVGFADKPQVLLSDELDRLGILYKYEATDSIVMKAVNNYQGKVMLVKLGDDNIIHNDVYSNYMAHISKPNMKLVELQGASHILGKDDKDKYANVLEDWFAKLAQSGL